MPTQRPSGNPYGAFNYIVALGGAQGDGQSGVVIGGFSDVSGLGVDISYSEYRNGNEKFNTTRKIPNTHKLDDITLKRGIMGSDDLFNWLKGVRDGTADPRNITITLLDEARNPVVTWAVRNAQPKKWAGPTLAAKGGGEVAMEELHLVHEGIDFK
jgi:phage tail-like protein